MHQFVAPYLQGAAMITNAWNGVDFSYVGHKALSLKERVVTWLIGVVLLIPLINTIVWFAWKTFGRPDELFDPYCPERVSPLAQRNAADSHSIEIPGVSQPAQVESVNNSTKVPEREVFIYKSSAGNINQIRKTQGDVTNVKETFGGAVVEAAYNPQGQILKSNYKKEEKEYDTFMDTHRNLQIVFKNNGIQTHSETHQLKPNIPWIQQPHIGMKQFVLSEPSKMDFCMAVPYEAWWLSSHLFQGVATKKTETVSGFGELVKVVLVPSNSILARIVGCWILWFDTKGNLVKMIDPGVFIKRNAELVLDCP
jgi:hypothetical protein